MGVSPPSRALTALVLIGQWSEEKEGDKEIVANIAGKPYQEVEQELTPLLNIADAPLTKIGERWRYVSHEEAWHILAPYLTSTKELFGQDRDPMFSGSPHTGLLWGLERLAWSKDYFSRVAVALARFAEIDHGGQVANRPAASLAELFCSWIKHTEATDEHRLETLSILQERYPEAGCAVLIKLAGLARRRKNEL